MFLCLGKIKMGLQKPAKSGNFISMGHVKSNSISINTIFNRVKKGD